MKLLTNTRTKIEYHHAHNASVNEFPGKADQEWCLLEFFIATHTNGSNKLSKADRHCPIT